MRPLHGNPPSRFSSTHLTYDEDLGLPEVPVTIVEDASRSIVSKNDSPDVGFTYSVNPYRGCFHGCAYCYARPTHENLGYGAGTDFERTIVVKRDAPKLLREAFEKRSWQGELVVFSGVTDPYQPIERDLGLTRACLEVCAEYKNPVGIITKSVLVERDAELLAEIARKAGARVTVSIPFSDADVARAMEPYVPTPDRRLKTIAVLAAAGVPVGISVSPLVPGLGEDGLAELLERAAAAGATHTFAVALRLPGSVREVFLERLDANLPLRAKKVRARLREMHGDSLYNAQFLVRQRGQGIYATALRAMFDSAASRAGLSLTVDTELASDRKSTFERPPSTKPGQLSLFGSSR